MERSKPTAMTLGQKLITQPPRKPFRFPLKFSVSMFLGLVGWAVADNIQVGLAVMGLSFAIFLFVYLYLSPKKPRHLLFWYDRQGFVKNLKLADKTAVFDGNNVYHFGLKNGVGTRALRLLVQELRSEGYRLVCYFDANIYFTLLENRAFQKGRECFSIEILQSLFGLYPHEIYVVPRGIQADNFIVETLEHLPKSVAITNDKFRDFEARYAFLTRDNQWRKGMKMNRGELTLFQHKFKEPLKLR